MTVHNRKKKFSHKVENIGTIYQRLKDGDTDEYEEYLEDEVDLQPLDDEDDAGAGGEHYLLSDGKTYIVLLGVIFIRGATVVSNIFFPKNEDKLDSSSTEDIIDQPDGRGAKPFLHPTMKVRSLMGGDVDVDFINEQITKVTRLPNAPDRSLPHLGKTGHMTNEQQQQQQQQQQLPRGGSMGAFSVVIPIYLGAIFVFFIYIVAKIVLKKMDGDKEDEEPVEVDKESYKDDSWWNQITDRINKVNECVKEGKDLELEEDDEIVELQKKEEVDDKNKVGSEQEFNVLKTRLDKTEKSLDNLVGQMDQLAGLVTTQSQLITQVLSELRANNTSSGNQ